MPTFRFAHSWCTGAPVDRVCTVLADVAGYPRWWPQVRAVARVDARTGWAVCRSVAPFDLDLLLTVEVEDPAHGELRVRLGGDLVGWCGFRLTPTSDSGCTVAFRQEVVVRRRLLAAAAATAEPLLRANHAWMMRGCRRGLAVRLTAPDDTDRRA